MVVLTVGHSNHSAEAFIALLRGASVRRLVDVRSAPYSRFHPQFNRKRLAETLAGAGIDYHFLGAALGGRPPDETCYRTDADGERVVDYAAVATRPWYQAGLEQLIALAGEVQVAIMCAERDPAHCHRERLVGASLRARGVTVRHLRPGDQLTLELDS